MQIYLLEIYFTLPCRAEVQFCLKCAIVQLLGKKKYSQQGRKRNEENGRVREKEREKERESEKKMVRERESEREKERMQA